MMWLGYRGYTIEVTAQESDGAWVGQVCIRRAIDDSKALQAEVAIGVFDRRHEAEEAGLRVGMERVDRLLEGKPRNP